MRSSRNCGLVNITKRFSCNRLENAVKPQQNGSKILLYSIFTSFTMLFVDFICQFQYIFLGYRAIRSATFLVLGVSDPTVSSNFAFSAFSKFPASFEVKSLQILLPSVSFADRLANVYCHNNWMRKHSHFDFLKFVFQNFVFGDWGINFRCRFDRMLTFMD